MGCFHFAKRTENCPKYASERCSPKSQVSTLIAFHASLSYRKKKMISLTQSKNMQLSPSCGCRDLRGIGSAFLGKLRKNTGPAGEGGR